MASATKSHDDDDEDGDYGGDGQSLAPSKGAKAVNIDDARFAIDYSRGEVLMESSDESPSDDDDEEDGGIDVWIAGQPDQHEKVEATEEVGRRLAICNLDWSRVRAADLFVLANSFKPETGVIESVNIYPSDFGLERMAIEETEGPGRLIREAAGSGPPPDDEDNERAQELLRAYELSKLRYFYAVVSASVIIIYYSITTRHTRNTYSRTTNWTML